MTVYVSFPPLIKPDGRFSRIRLSEFLSRRVKPTRQPGFTTPGLFWALVASEEAVTTSFVVLPVAEQVASLRSPAFSPNQRSGAGSTLLRTPPTSAMGQTASSF